MTTIIAETLDAYAKSLERVFSTDRRNTVGASEIGQCMRKIWWLKRAHIAEAPIDEGYTESWGARLRGTMFEEYFWVPAMRARFGDRLLYAGSEQKTLVKGKLSATPDGIIVNLTRAERMLAETRANCVTVECKTVDPRTNLSAAKQTNVYQTQVQMGLFRDVTPFKPERAVISYTDTSFWNETKEFVVKYDESVYLAAHDRANTIMAEEHKAADMPPEGWIAGGDECRYCPFTQACGIERRSLPFAEEKVDDAFKEEMTDAAIMYRDYEATRDKYDMHMRRLADRIKTRLREKSVKKIPGVLSWSSIKGRTSYDTTRMVEELSRRGVDCEQYQTIAEPSDRLTITLKVDKVS